jgi:hypothetical protein
LHSQTSGSLTFGKTSRSPATGVAASASVAPSMLSSRIEWMETLAGSAMPGR